MIITREKTSNPDESTLSRKELLLLQKTAGEIQPIKENNFQNIRCLLDEINHLSKWFRWTSEEKNLVLLLKLKGRITEKLTNFDIFNDWTKNCDYITEFCTGIGSWDKINEVAEKGPNKHKTNTTKPQLNEKKKCHFCGHLGHLIKNCNILKKIKLKKNGSKIQKTIKKEVNSMISTPYMKKKIVLTNSSTQTQKDDSCFKIDNKLATPFIEEVKNKPTTPYTPFVRKDIQTAFIRNSQKLSLCQPNENRKTLKPNFKKLPLYVPNSQRLPLGVPHELHRQIQLSLSKNLKK